jgi:hypothetical protein
MDRLLPSIPDAPANDAEIVTAGELVVATISPSLSVEFNPEPFHRIAVGDKAWVDLDPAPLKPATPGPPGPPTPWPAACIHAAGNEADSRRYHRRLGSHRIWKGLFT